MKSLHFLEPIQSLSDLHTVHPVVHISMLEPATPNPIPNHIQPPLPPIIVDDEPVYLLRIQVSVQILIPLIFYSAQFILLIFHSCMHLQSASVCCVCCDSCDCIVSQECDSVTSALFQRLRYEFVCSSLFWTVSYFSFRQFVR